MSTKIIFLIILFIACFPLPFVPLSAQEEEGEIIIISERVGKEIDPEEAERFNFFQNFKGFQSAVYLKLPDGRYFLKITYLDEKTGELKVNRIQQSEASIKNRGKYIDRFEEIQAKKQQTVSAAPYASTKGMGVTGLRGGLNLANVSGEDVENADSRLGFAIGGFVTYRANEQFSLRPEIYYTTKGCKLKVKGSESDVGYEISYSAESSVSLNYLEIPVLGVFAVNKNINLFAGPYLDIYLNGKAKEEWKIHSRYLDPTTNEWVTEDESTSESNDIESEDMNSTGYGLIFGAEYSFGKLSLGARYSLGLSAISDEDDNDSKHKVIQFLVGFQLP